MRVIFLDFDGVMNCRGCIGVEARAGCPSALFPVDAPNWIGKKHVAAFNALLKRVPDAQVVVSSTWRILSTISELEMLLMQARVDRYTILDVTSQRYPPSDARAKWEEPMTRGWQIDQWLLGHPEVTSFVILDDDADMWVHQRCLVRTSYSFGLQMEHVEPAVRILLREEKK